ncbi:histidine triad protein HinT [Candidatus Mycoplasma pogonae]
MEKTIFQKIIDREIPSEIIYEDDKVIAIKDIKPVREGHFLVIPKNHSTNLIDIEEQDFLYTMSKARELALKIIKDMGVAGFNLVVNNHADAGQEVFHTHIHIVPSHKK